jgi:hypothetical protein
LGQIAKAQVVDNEPFEGYLVYASRDEKGVLVNREKMLVRADSLLRIPLGGIPVLMDLGKVLIYGKANERYTIHQSRSEVKLGLPLANAKPSPLSPLVADSIQVLDYWGYPFTTSRYNPFGLVRSTVWLCPTLKIQHAPLFAKCMDYGSTFFGSGERMDVPLRVEETSVDTGSKTITELEEVVRIKLPPDTFQLPKGYKLIRE